MTEKKLRKQLQARFSLDLSDRKDEIKAVVRTLPGRFSLKQMSSKCLLVIHRGW